MATTLVKIDDYWINPETISYLQPSNHGEGCYINFVYPDEGILIKDKTPDQIASLLRTAGAVNLRDAKW